MLLITSAAYVTGELISEIGMLPPTFLPVGNRCLYEHQVLWARKMNFKDIYISLPESFKIDAYSIKWFKDNNLQIITVPDNLSLGESIAFCWSCLTESFHKLHILHGDTLVLDCVVDPSISKNSISLSHNVGFYDRAKIVKSGKHDTEIKIINELALESENVLSGYFSLASGAEFNKCLHKVRFNFIDALNMYLRDLKVEFIKCSQWLDFGHITSFYHSRREITTQREFNGLTISNKEVTKSSWKKSKMQAEHNWISSLPSILQCFVPNVYGYHEDEHMAYYTMEYLYSVSLADIAVFSLQESYVWELITNEVLEFLNRAKKFKPLDVVEKLSACDDLYLPKTLERMKEFKDQSNVCLESVMYYQGESLGSLLYIAKHTSQFIEKTKHSHLAVVHGDLCFSNIMFDFRAKRLRLLDPRGIDLSGNLSIYGDQRYDLAKYCHSVFGLYDFIIAGRVTLSVKENSYSLEFYDVQKFNVIQSVFETTISNNSTFNFKEIMAITVHLFLSMLPLHSDDKLRQSILLANALRLYKEYFIDGNK